MNNGRVFKIRSAFVIFLCNSDDFKKLKFNW